MLPINLRLILLLGNQLAKTKSKTMTLKKSLVALSLVLLTMISPLVAKDANKTIKTKITQGVYLEYYGLADKKTPMGNGKLTVYVNDKAVDVISGIFNNNSITDATVTYKGGKLVFKGDVKYSTSDTEIVYVVSNGFFEINGEANKEPITENTTIRRLWRGLDLSINDNNTIQYTKSEVVKENKNVNPMYRDKWDWEFFNSFNDFVGAKPITVTKKLKMTLDLNKNQLENTYIDAFVIDYGEKGNGILNLENQKYIMAINCSNGDMLSFMGLSTISPLTSLERYDIIHNIDGGKLEIHSTKDGNFNLRNTNYNDDGMPLVKKFYSDMPENYKPWIERNNELYIQREEKMAENGELSSYRIESEVAVEITYENGDTYLGTIYLPRTFDKDVQEILKSKELPQNKDYYSGLYTTNNEEKTYYLFGYKADEYVRVATQKVEEKRLNAEMFEKEKEKRNKEAVEAWKATEKAAKDRRLAQEKKYGKKYVDAIYDQYTILVGTPEGLLKEQYILDVKTETTKSTVYYVKRTHDVLFIVWVDKSTHKVDMVTNLQE